jgi:hypothetical protein
MSPEFPADLMVLDLRFHGNDLVGEVYVIERDAEARQQNERLRVSWNARTAPGDSFSVAGGAVFVANRPTTLRRDYEALPDILGEGRYAWRYPTDSDLMMVLVFPDGYVPDDCRPFPLRAKELRGRVAAFWKFGAESGEVQWALRRSEVDAAREAIRINKNATKQKNMVVGALSVEDTTDGRSRWPRSDVLALVGILVTAVGSVAAVFAIPGLHDWIFGVSGPTSELGAQPSTTSTSVVQEQSSIPAQGPIAWQDIQLQPDVNRSIRRIQVYGITISPIEIKSSYIISNYTSKKLRLMAVIYNQRNEEKLLPVDNIRELQPDAGMWLVAQFNQQISGQDFLDRWGRLTVMITYDHGNYERLYDETSIRHKLRDIGIELGPRVTKKNGD